MGWKRLNFYFPGGLCRAVDYLQTDVYDNDISRLSNRFIFTSRIVCLTTNINLINLFANFQNRTSLLNKLIKIIMYLFIERYRRPGARPAARATRCATRRATRRATCRPLSSLKPKQTTLVFLYLSQGNSNFIHTSSDETVR